MTQLTLEQHIIQAHEIAKVYQANRNNPNIENAIIGYIRLHAGRLSLLAVKFLRAKNIELGAYLY